MTRTNILAVALAVLSIQIGIPAVIGAQMPSAEKLAASAGLDASRDSTVKVPQFRAVAARTAGDEKSAWTSKQAYELTKIGPRFIRASDFIGGWKLARTVDMPRIEGGIKYPGSVKSPTSSRIRKDLDFVMDEQGVNDVRVVQSYPFDAKCRIIEGRELCKYHSYEGCERDENQWLFAYVSGYIGCRLINKDSLICQWYKDLAGGSPGKYLMYSRNSISPFTIRPDPSHG
ncbi:MAG TPA: hypothetical protein DEB40_05675 [Elusimicrobia bacterium]|nr:hypothetical protein [Elusimicrobiota bacterium]HBT61214.1 hypothetical protein [Elusimicrobiota bacterium]